MREGTKDLFHFVTNLELQEMQGGPNARDQNTRPGIKPYCCSEGFHGPTLQRSWQIEQEPHISNHTFDATRQCWVAILVLSTEYFSKKHIVNIAGAGCRCEISSEWHLQPQDNLSFYTAQEFFSYRTRGKVAWSIRTDWALATLSIESRKAEESIEGGGKQGHQFSGELGKGPYRKLKILKLFTVLAQINWCLRFFV